MLAVFQGDYARAATFSPEGLALARELGDPLLVGQALTIAGFLAYRQGEYGQAEELLKEGYARLSQLGDTVPSARLPTPASRSSSWAVWPSLQEQFDRAARWNEASLEHFQRGWQRLGDRRSASCPRSRQLLHRGPRPSGRPLRGES